MAVGDEFAELTRTEYQLLELLMLNPRRVLPPCLIYERVWGYDFGPSSNALRVYIGYLRRKLQQAGARPLIHTVRGVGLRAARAVSLRTRIAAAGTLAVAVTVLLAAVIVYLGVRAELRGEIDSSLGNVADLVQVRSRRRRPAPGPFDGPIPLDRDRLRRRAEPYGGATGYVQLVTDGGAALPPPGVGAPARAGRRGGTPDRARRDGREPHRHDRGRHAPARAHARGRRAAARCRWRARSPRWTSSSAASC